MASKLIDNLIAIRLLYMLITPFKDTEAYKLGIIDAEGVVLRKLSTLNKQEEKDNYNYLTRFVFNVKRILAKLPGGDSKLKNLTAAYFLVKESYEKKLISIKERDLIYIIEKDITLVEEQILVEKFLKKINSPEIVPASEEVGNVTGAGVSTDQPVPSVKDIKKYKNMARRVRPIDELNFKSLTLAPKKLKLRSIISAPNKNSIKPKIIKHPRGVY